MTALREGFEAVVVLVCVVRGPSFVIKESGRY